jgi:hypothetical protein
VVYASPHLYVTMGGPSYDDQETWQTGVRFAPVPPADWSIDFTGPQEIAEDLITPVSTWWTSSVIPFSVAAQLAWVKVAQIGPDGRYVPVEGNPGIAEITPPTPGPSSGVPAPQLSVAVTLDSGSRLGRARTGRCYLPPANINVSGTSGLISENGANAVRDSFAGLLADMRDIINAVVVTGILQPAIMSEIGSGTTRQVQGVRVGRVIDTQRRRRRGLPESYTALAPVV